VAAGGGTPGDGPNEGAPRIHSMNVGAGGAGEMQALEEQRMATIESPAGKRETLGDKVRLRWSLEAGLSWGGVGCAAVDLWICAQCAVKRCT
jgi:hypothetical protein